MLGLEAKQCRILPGAVPAERVGAARREILTGLPNLEKHGLAESGKMGNDVVFCRRYQITPSGTT